MAKKSITVVHGRLTADGTPMINEFKRADNETRRSTASMRASVQKTMRDINREFSLPKLAKGLMSGLGIGSGMQLVDAGIGKLREIFEQPAKNAAEFTERIKEMRKELRGLQENRFEFFIDGLKPGEKASAIGRQADMLRARLAKAQSEKGEAETDIQMARDGLTAGRVFNPFSGMMTADPYGGRFAEGTGASEIIKAGEEKQLEKQKEIEELRDKIKQLERTGDKATGEANKERWKPLVDALKEFNDGITANAKKLESAGKQLTESMMTPQEKLDAALTTANELWRADKINEATLNRASRSAFAAFDKETNPLNSSEFAQWERAAGKVQADDMTRRGLGTGAKYDEVNRQTVDILKQILDVIRTAKANGLGGAAYN